MAGDKVLAVNDVNFEDEVIASDVPVLVDFSAEWCGPCRQLAPLVDQLAEEYDGRVKVAKVDIDESPATAQKLGIRGVPTIYVFRGGEVVAQQVGAAPKKTLVDLVEKALA